LILSQELSVSFIGLFNNAFITVECQDDWQGYEKKQLRSAFMHFPRICLQGLTKIIKTPKTVGGLLANFSTGISQI
jgi:hypothetical protein